MAQVVAKELLLAAVAVGMGCRSSPVVTYALPVNPVATVGAFMNAAKANDLAAMARLWGTRRGPMVGRMDPGELDRRLTVMQRYLTHERFEVLEGVASVTAREDVRSYRVRITRRGCVHVVPFELVRIDGGWLVSNVDLDEAGNPGRVCGGSQQRGTRSSRAALVIP